MGLKFRFVNYDYDFSSVGKRLLVFLVFLLLYIIVSTWFTVSSRGVSFLKGLGL